MYNSRQEDIDTRVRSLDRFEKLYKLLDINDLRLLFKKGIVIRIAFERAFSTLNLVFKIE